MELHCVLFPQNDGKVGSLIGSLCRQNKMGWREKKKTTTIVN
jgi:hypothetical protein